MHIYSGPRPLGEELPIPVLDVWNYLLGSAFDERGIPSDKRLAVDVVTKQEITYGEARDLSQRIAHGLRKAGLQEGQTVCIFSQNSIVWPVIAMAIQCASLVGALANYGYTVPELKHLLKDSGSVAIFASSDTIDIAEKAAKELGIDPGRIWAVPGVNGKVAPGKRSYTELDTGKHWQHTPIVKEKLAVDPAYLPYSSGTTGVAKGVVMSHRNVVAMSEQLLLMPNLIDRETRMVLMLPMFHAYALTLGVHHIMRVGGTAFILSKFEMPRFLSVIPEYRITFVPIVPPVALGLTKHPGVTKEGFKSVKRVIAGAAPMSRELTLAVEHKTGVPCCQGYGMTETSAVGAMASPTSNNYISVGNLAPYVRARVIDEEGKDVAKGERGELILDGPNIVPRYHNNDKATQDSYIDGWLKTGDVVVLDEQERITIVDRRKELIKNGGFQVPPAELEALLLTSELVDDCAVIGVHSEERATELPRGYVVLSEAGKKHRDAPGAIAAFVADRTIYYKHLRGGVIPIDTIPKSASGKILRKDLRIMAAKEQKERASKL